MKYLGVIINKIENIIPGSDLRELKDGRMVACKPKFNVCYQFAGSYPYETLKECKSAIKSVYDACVEKECVESFVEVMNSN